MIKVQNESEAIQLCKEYQCEIKFWKQGYNVPEYVVVSLNAWTKIAGRNLIEAVNRLVDVYHTAPINQETLEWWKDHENLYYQKYIKE
jgi:hypothetical protein